MGKSQNWHNFPVLAPRQIKSKFQQHVNYIHISLNEIKKIKLLVFMHLKYLVRSCVPMRVKAQICFIHHSKSFLQSFFKSPSYSHDLTNTLHWASNLRMTMKNSSSPGTLNTSHKDSFWMQNKHFLLWYHTTVHVTWRTCSHFHTKCMLMHIK